MSSSQRRIVASCRLGLIGTLVAALDYWLWPQLNSERLTSFDNSTSTVVTATADYELMRTQMDDFFDQWNTKTCINDFELNCNFYFFMITYCLYSFSTFLSCLTLHSIPRYGIGFSIFAGSSFNLFHQYVVRGRFVQPDALALWGAQFGTLTGPTTWGCICFMCETGPASSVVTLTPPNP